MDWFSGPLDTRWYSSMQVCTLLSLLFLCMKFQVQLWKNILALGGILISYKSIKEGTILYSFLCPRVCLPPLTVKSWLPLQLYFTWPVCQSARVPTHTHTHISRISSSYFNDFLDTWNEHTYLDVGKNFALNCQCCFSDRLGSSRSTTWPEDCCFIKRYIFLYLCFLSLDTTQNMKHGDITTWCGIFFCFVLFPDTIFTIVTNINKLTYTAACWSVRTFSLTS